MLQKGERVPDFEVTTLDGARVAYSNIWQRDNLALVRLPAIDTDASRRYASELAAREADFAGRTSVCVITRDPVEGLPASGIVIADRWGEIAYSVAGASAADLPAVPDLLDWLDYLQSRCPECEGEAR
jgi:peroxiredoxin